VPSVQLHHALTRPLGCAVGMGVFTRDEDELLSYDVDAFWYFAATLLIASATPWTCLLLKTILWPKPTPEEDYDGRGPAAAQDVTVTFCATTAMEAKRRKTAERTKSWNYRLSGGIRYQIIFVGMLWVMLVVVVWKLRDAPAQLRKFDPYTILDISVDAEMKDIKKAYRSKSLQHHPDKDRDNPMASFDFQQVAKAYAALTDDKARRNYAKYGNPDGQQQMKVGIALHPAILMKQHQIRTLCIFFFVLLAVPFCILCCCLRGSRLSYGGVSADTLRMLHACIDEEVEAEDGPCFLGASAEAIRAMRSDLQCLAKAILDKYPTPLEPGVIVEVFSGPVAKNGVKLTARGVVKKCSDDQKTCEVEIREFKAGEAEGQGEVRKIQKEWLAPIEPRTPCLFSDMPVRRNCLLIWGHLWRLHEHMPEPALVELDTVLRHSVAVVRAMISMATPHDNPAFLGVVRNLVVFRRCLVQALDITKGSPLLQLPHVEASQLTAKVLKDAPSFRDVVSGGCDKFLDGLKLNQEQRLDVDSFCRHVPLVELSCKAEVLDEEGVSCGDVATLVVTLTRTNLAEGKAAGPVHSPFFPVPKFEEWWIIVFDERDRRLITVDLINGTGRVETSKVNFMVPRAGDFRWTVHAMCDSYAGLDVSCSANFTTLKRNAVDREIFVHPDDMHIKTFFEELMEGLNPEEREEESESEDELPLRAIAGNKAARPKDSTAAAAVAVAAGAVEAVVAQEAKPQIQHSEDCDDSDCEGCDDELQEPEGTFFEVTALTGAFLHREPGLEEELRIGSIPSGTIIRAFGVADNPQCPPGWAELAGAQSAWLYVGEPDDASMPDTDEDPVSVKQLSGLLELPLRTIVQTRLPLLLLRRWIKRTTAEITVEDVSQIADIEETRIRMTIEELIRKRIGDTRYEELLDKTAAEAVGKKERISKARGYFNSQNGIVWHVNPQGTVRGMHPDGSKIRDRIFCSPENEIRLGPFALDETRTCSCIHWIRKDDPEKAWAWGRDNTVDTRVRMGNW